MEKQQEYSPLFDSSYIIQFLLKSRKRLIIVALLAATVSAIVSFLIEPRYLSSVILIPTSTTSVSKSLIKEWGDILTVGQEKEAEQMIQVLHSDAIRNRISERYKLMERYKIKKNDPYKKLSFKQEFLDRVWFDRNPDYSVSINVLDRNPDTAAFIANDIAVLLDSVRNRVQKERAMKAVKIVEDEYLKKKVSVEKLQDSLRTYTEQGIFDFETQSGIIYKQYVKSIAKNNTKAADELDKKMKLIGKKGWNYVALRDFAYHERNEMFTLGLKYEQAKIDVERSLPSKYIIDPAVPSEKRLSPNRLLIVVVATLSSVLLAIIITIALEKPLKTE